MPRHFKVTVNGREYEVSVLELAPGENAPAPAAAVGVAGMAAPGAAPATVTAAHAAPAAPGAAGDVVAGMGGVVVEVHVNPFDLLADFLGYCLHHIDIKAF